MKLLSLRFKNLNSLVGEWKIDFTAPQYESDGIFLITGPTGSGKTTILDAICLALYGRTPRQKSFSDNVNEMLPRGQRECMAEVTFETPSGRYRSMWSHERTGPRSKKPFQAPKFRLENADSEITVATNTEGKREVQKIVGMDFEQFTRSMMLAQGNFAAFLQSRPNERSEILEQITGTEIYSRISGKVFEVEKQKREEIAARLREIAEIDILDEATHAAIVAEQKDCELGEVKCREEVARQNALLDWKRLLLRLEEELRKILLEESALANEDAAFAPMREKLARAQRAERVEAAWELFCASRKSLEAQRAKIAEGERKLPQFAATLKKTVNDLQAAIKAREEAESIFGEAREKLNQAEIMDAAIREKKENLERAQADHKNFSEQLDKCKQKLAVITSQLEKEEKNLAELSGWLLEHAPDEKIAPQIPLLDRNVSEIFDLKNNIEIKKTELGIKEEESAATQNELAKKDDELKKCSLRHLAKKEETENLRNSLAEILAGDEVEALRDELEKLRLERQQRLVFRDPGVLDLRASLKDGEPCPVCGALHHPFAEGSAPETDELEARIKEMEDRSKRAADLARKITAAEKSVLDSERAEFALENDKHKIVARLEIIRNDLKARESEIADLEKRCELAETQCAQIFAQFNLDGKLSAGDGLKALEARANAWEKNIAQKDALATSIINIRIKQQQEESARSLLEENFAETGKRVAIVAEDCNKSIAERKQQFGDLDAARVEMLKLTFGKAKNGEEKAREANANTEKDYAAKEMELKTMRENLLTLEDDNAMRRQNFAADLAREKFFDESEFVAARLAREEQENLRARDNEFRERKVEILTRKTEKRTESEREKARDLSPLTLEELERLQKDAISALSSTLERIGFIKSKLQTNELNIAKIGVKKTELEKMRREHRIYEELNSLIGQKTGDKFRQFAQGLTFETLVKYANRQMAVLNDRYLLQMDPDKPLELNVIDNYQAGERRATSNLSGGESFIASLALALGLAGMGSKRTRVDSLFLDEGFGTLDEESLETTMATLENLKSDGKLIGIISHVAALREKIGTRIELVGTGGRSSLSGPGCEKL